MSDPREAIADALKGFLTPEQTKKLVDEVLAVTKRGKAEFNCRSCGARQYQYAEIPDARAVAGALTDLANQAYGRPTEASAQNDPIQFVRLTNMGELADYDGSKPARGPRRTTKIDKGRVARQAGSASRKKTSVDKSLE